VTGAERGIGESMERFVDESVNRLLQWVIQTRNGSGSYGAFRDVSGYYGTGGRGWPRGVVHGIRWSFQRLAWGAVLGAGSHPVGDAVFRREFSASNRDHTQKVSEFVERKIQDLTLLASFSGRSKPLNLASASDPHLCASVFI